MQVRQPLIYYRFLPALLARIEIEGPDASTGRGTQETALFSRLPTWGQHGEVNTILLTMMKYWIKNRREWT